LKKNEIFFSHFAFGRRIKEWTRELADEKLGPEIGMNMRLNLTLPVYNEEQSLPGAVARLTDYLSKSPFAGCCEIVIAENGSTDRTFEVASELAENCSDVRVLRIAGKGRGRALKEAWSGSDAEVLSYMDIDLSTDLVHYPQLIEPLFRGEFDLAIGSRLLRSDLTTRGWKRELISRGYNRLMKILFSNRFSDAQCGFKALTRRAADILLPEVKDDGWFFDTELLLLAERMNFRILDLPVRWKDDPDSRVRIFHTIVHDLKGLARVRRQFARREI
jgi:glycosyltransferase involved in cell wall biosynthesis